MPHSDDPPALFAVPGNHDWYDGLTAFLRFFCQGGWVGGWKTEQRRSYFAVKLPQRWWLLGIDIQFDTYIDAPQIDYFRTVAAAHRGRRRHHPVQRQAELGRGRQAEVERLRDPRLLHHRGARQGPGPGAADARRRPAPLRPLRGGGRRAGADHLRRWRGLPVGDPAGQGRPHAAARHPQRRRGGQAAAVAGSPGGRPTRRPPSPAGWRCGCSTGSRAATRGSSR